MNAPMPSPQAFAPSAAPLGASPSPGQTSPPRPAAPLRFPLPAFDLPLPRGAAARPDLGRMGEPDPTHGQVVCASSTVNRDGTSTLIEPVGVVGRVAFATAITLLFGAPIIAVPIDLVIASQISTRTLNDLPGPVVALIFAIAPVLAFVLVFRFIFKRWGKGQPFGETSYVGTEGARAIRRYYDKVTESGVRFVDAFTVLHGVARVVNTRGFTHDEERLSFFDARGIELLSLSSITQLPEPRTAEAILVAEAARLSCARRAERAQATLSAGGALTFPIFEDERLGSRKIVARGRALQIVDDANPAATRSFDVRSVTISARAGELQIAPREPSQAGFSVSLACLGDSDVLLSLFGG